MSNRRLLVADDSVTIRRVIDLTFADENFDVVAVADGDAAVDELSAEKPDVVLADVHMPGLNGYQICELIKSSAETKNIPVVLLVGFFEPFDEAEATRVQADAHLTKPFQSIKLLVDKVSELVQRSEPATETVDQEGVETAEFPTDNEIEPVPAETSEPGKRTPDTSDIDCLYTASFAETVKIPEDGEPETKDFVDAGMDDEMIETSYVSDPSVVRSNGSGSPSEPEARNRSPVESNDDIAALETAPLAAESVRRSPFDTIAEPVEGTGHDEDSSFLFSGYETNPGTPAASEDMDLLELPTADAPQKLEFTTPKAAAESGGSQVVSISPELMEIIVQKVIERLSERE